MEENKNLFRYDENYKIEISSNESSEMNNINNFFKKFYNK